MCDAYLWIPNKMSNVSRSLVLLNLIVQKEDLS